jgi:hypothetical protein
LVCSFVATFRGTITQLGKSLYRKAIAGKSPA